MLKLIYSGLLLIALYISFCVGSYFATINNSNLMNLQSVGNIRLNAITIDSINKNNIDFLRQMSLGIIELELLSIIETKKRRGVFSIKEFFIAPWYLARYKLEIDERKIELIKECIEQLKSSSPQKSVDTKCLRLKA